MKHFVVVVGAKTRVKTILLHVLLLLTSFIGCHCTHELYLEVKEINPITSQEVFPYCPLFIDFLLFNFVSQIHRTKTSRVSFVSRSSSQPKTHRQCNLLKRKNRQLLRVIFTKSNNRFVAIRKNI